MGSLVLIYWIHGGYGKYQYVKKKDITRCVIIVCYIRQKLHCQKRSCFIEKYRQEMRFLTSSKLSNLYSISLSSGSDVVRLFAIRSAKSRASREIAHIGSRARKNKECVHELKSRVCVLTSLPEDSETEYSLCVSRKCLCTSVLGHPV